MKILSPKYTIKFNRVSLTFIDCSVINIIANATAKQHIWHFSKYLLTVCSLLRKKLMNGTKFLTTNRTYAVFTCVCPGVCGTGLEDSKALWKAERKILLSCTTWGLNCIKELPVTLLVNLLKVKKIREWKEDGGIWGWELEELLCSQILP